MNCTKLEASQIQCDDLTEYTCPESPLKCIKYDNLCNGKKSGPTNDCTKSVCDKQISKLINKIIKYSFFFSAMQKYW